MTVRVTRQLKVCFAANVLSAMTFFSMVGIANRPANLTPMTVVQTDAGTALADPHGLVLYSFDGDGKGVSNCDDKCLKDWRPYIAGVNSGAPQPVRPEFSYVSRKDGKLQYAYQGRPLYQHIGDKPKEIKGEKDSGGKWHVVQVPDDWKN